MKKMIFVIAAIVVAVVMCADKAYAPLVLQTSQDSSSSSESSSDSSSNQDTSVVDLSDKDTDQATWSPSFDNE